MDSSTEDQVLTNVDGQASGEWTDRKTNRPAGEAILSFVLEEPWTKPRFAQLEPRPRAMAVLIREKTSGETLWSWNEKKEGEGTIEQALASWIESFLTDDPEPQLLRLWVHRTPLPDLHDFDSSRIFIVVNEAWYLAANETAGTDGPAASSYGIPPIMQGPGPLRFATPPSPIQLTGDIGGTGIATVAEAGAQNAMMYTQQMQNLLQFTVDIITRVLAWQAEMNRRGPDSEIRREELRHERRMKAMDFEQATHGQTVREVGGMATDFAAGVARTPVGQKIIAGAAKKLGILEDAES